MRTPFAEDNFFFELIFLFARPVFNGFKYTYILFLYTAPYVCYSVLLSAPYIFALKIPGRISPGRLPRYPDLRKRPSLEGTTQKKSFSASPTTEATTGIQNMPATRLRKLGWKSNVNGIP